MKPKLIRLFYILAFIEGGAVMCVELCSAKMLSPYFGTSIYVWAAVLGITLTALMSGYYLGGHLSAQNKKPSLIYWLMLFGGLWVTLTPFIGDFILPITIHLDLLLGTVISLCCILFVPLLFFGAVSPLVINTLTTKAKASGKSTGNVYAVSTLGGIITTFSVGFYTLPQHGITYTLYGFGVLIMAVACLLFIQTKSFKTPVSIIVLAGILSINFQHPLNHPEIIYQSEGILGQLKVVDRNLPNLKTNSYRKYRELMVNNISQTILDIEDPSKSYWDYVDILSYNINSFAQGKKTLLLGLGGGTLYNKLERNGLEVDVVELDERMEYIAKTYFNIPKNVPVIVDDARHYIRTTQNKYNIIIYDLYHSETPPIHLMTQEAFAEINTNLEEKGLLVINFYGFTTGKKGLAAQSIYKTLLKEGYFVELIATPGEEANRNLLFICSTSPLNPKHPIIDQVIPKNDLPLNNAFILTDDKPILEHIYLEAALSWRKNYNEINAKYFLSKK